MGPVKARGSLGEGKDLLDLDEFCEWCRDALALDVIPNPEANFHHDIGLDGLEMFELIVQLSELVGREAQLNLDAFESLSDVRDLHLYYLRMNSMPNG